MTASCKKGQLVATFPYVSHRLEILFHIREARVYTCDKTQGWTADARKGIVSLAGLCGAPGVAVHPGWHDT